MRESSATLQRTCLQHIAVTIFDLLLHRTNATHIPGLAVRLGGTTAGASHASSCACRAYNGGAGDKKWGLMSRAISFSPHIVVLMLGTNDVLVRMSHNSTHDCWAAEEFIRAGGRGWSHVRKTLCFEEWFWFSPPNLFHRRPFETASNLSKSATLMNNAVRCYAKCLINTLASYVCSAEV